MKKDLSAAQTVIQEVLKVKKSEKVLIISNPEMAFIAQDLYTASNEVGGETTLIFQKTKTSMDNAEPAVIGALKSEPDVVLSISKLKMGKDAQATATPYTMLDGKQFDNIFDYLLLGKKCIRGVWSPGLTQDMFERTAIINYKDLGISCKTLCEKFTNAVSVHVTAMGGTDITISIEGRTPFSDDGDFSKPGVGGNIPAGEVFISPALGKSNGTIVFDGSMTFSDGDAILENPIKVQVADGFATEITGGKEAKRLLQTITEAETKSLQMEKIGTLQKNMGEVYKKNARNIGELGIGLNPAATITGNMLEDEKAFKTCHFALGANYDDDAPCLIHLDGVVRNPTIVLTYKDNTTTTILENGSIKI